MGKEEGAYKRSSVRMSSDCITAHCNQKSGAKSLKFYINQMSRLNKGISDHKISQANLVFTLAKSVSKPSKSKIKLCDMRTLMQKEGENPNESDQGRSQATALEQA